MSICTIHDSGRSYRIIDPGGRVGSKVVNGEPYERRLLVDIRQRHHRGTAVDVGAHVGNHTLYLAAICGLRVLAFECHAPTVARLEANVALNPGLDITVHDEALGSADGSGHLTGGRWVEFDPTRDDKGHLSPGGDVKVRRFDDLYTLDDLTVVKVDVEGTEPHVLAGMASNIDANSPAIYAETHSNAAESAIRDVLGPLGYEVTRHIRMGSMMHRWERR